MSGGRQIHVPSQASIEQDLAMGKLRFSTAFAHIEVRAQPVIVSNCDENWMDDSKPITANPPNIRTFYEILKQKPLRFRIVSMIYRCKTCEGAAKVKKDFSKLLKTIRHTQHIGGTPEAQKLCIAFVKGQRTHSEH